MELSWSTFLLEIINFLVLVWILKRFLYKPVLDVIARRRADIKERLDESRRLNDEANELKAKYENRLADWDKERQAARDSLAQELDEERGRQHEALQTMLAEETEKARVAESRQRAEAVRETERLALQQSAEFAARLLAQATGPELEARLLSLLLEGLSTLSTDQADSLRTQWGELPVSITVKSAYPLPDNRRHELEDALRKVTGLNLPVQYAQDPELLAGLQIAIGAWLLCANVRDELTSFAEFAHATR